MAAYLKVENKLVTCPYDPAHKVKESRLQLHIAKCKQNNLDKEKAVCPFNFTHLFDPSEKAFHLSNCPDRAPLDRQLANGDLNKNNPFKGYTAVPSYTESAPVECEESWDADISYQPRPGYVPQSAPAGAILEPREMAKPAERKEFYKKLHQLNSEPPVLCETAKSPPQPSEPRQPKTLSATSPLQTKESLIAANLQNLGLGRGRPGRIAANFFAPGNQVTSSEKSFSEIANGLNQLGLGRGRGINSAAMPNLQDDDNFPALGFGRGTHRISKNAPGVPGPREPM